MDTPDKDLKDYEISFLGAEESVAQVVAGILATHKAEVIHEGSLEKIALAYKIKKHGSAYFGYLHFRTASETAKKIEMALQHESRVIRFLIVTPPFQKPKPRWEGRTKQIKSPEAMPPQPMHKVEPLPLSNEALEKKIEEILQ